MTSAFFDREAKGIDKKGYSIFKLAMDAKEKPRSKNIPKEATRGWRPRIEVRGLSRYAGQVVVS